MRSGHRPGQHPRWSRELAVGLLAMLAASGAAPPAAGAFDLQGHRGARGLAPENTLAAFRKAIQWCVRCHPPRVTATMGCRAQPAGSVSAQRAVQS